MKMTNELLMDYVDGTLDAARLAAVEAHLAKNAEDAEMVANMKMALGALHDWNDAEPVMASENFWPRLREKLPAQPPRSLFRSVGARMHEWLWPANSTLRLSTRVAAIAILVAMAVALFSPKGAQHRVEALTPSDKTFIEQAVKRHSAYVSSQPATAPALPGDGANTDGDDDDGDDNSDYTP